MHHLADILNTFIIGDVLQQLKKIPDKCVRCIVTSPPYYGLRDYGTAIWMGGDSNCDHSRATNVQSDATSSSTLNSVKNQVENHTARKKEKHICRKCGAKRIDMQIGLEKTPEEYIAKMVLIFRECRRILTDDGTLWINIGDSYWGGKGQSGASAESNKKRNEAGRTINKEHHAVAGKKECRPTDGRHSEIKPKDLIGIPWMLAFALRADGWWLRQDIIWHKPNPMPESVTDRCTKAHEYIFLFSKSRHYYYDSVAIRVPIAESVVNDKRLYDENYEAPVINNGLPRNPNGMSHGGGLLRRRSGNLIRVPRSQRGAPDDTGKNQSGNVPWEGAMANKKSVWTVTPKGFAGKYCTACERYYSGKEKSMIKKVVEKINGHDVKCSYCLCGRHDAWISHFASFPQHLIIDCIKAATSEHGHCTDCGSPWIRVTQKELKPGPDSSPGTVADERDRISDGNDMGSNKTMSGHKPGFYNDFTTIGWQPSCECHGKMKKNTMPVEPLAVYDEDDNEIVGYEDQPDHVYYTYESSLPLEQHPIQPDVVMDIFHGTGTTGIVSFKLNRKYIGIDANGQYVKMSCKRTEKELGMFYEVKIVE